MRSPYGLVGLVYSHCFVYKENSNNNEVSWSLSGMTTAATGKLLLTAFLNLPTSTFAYKEQRSLEFEI